MMPEKRLPETDVRDIARLLVRSLVIEHDLPLLGVQGQRGLREVIGGRKSAVMMSCQLYDRGVCQVYGVQVFTDDEAGDTTETITTRLATEVLKSWDQRFAARLRARTYRNGDAS